MQFDYIYPGVSSDEQANDYLFDTAKTAGLNLVCTVLLSPLCVFLQLFSMRVLVAFTHLGWQAVSVTG